MTSIKWHKHTADVEFTVKTKTVNTMFEQCIIAVTQTMVEIESVDSIIQKYFEFPKDNIERALFNVLSEIIYLKDAEQFIVSSCTVHVTEQVQVTLQGTFMNDTIEQRVDVKAITMHKFKVEHNDSWNARVVLDI